MTIYQLDADDRELLAAYSAIDRWSGDIFEDENCTELAEGWRELVILRLDRAL